MFVVARELEPEVEESGELDLTGIDDTEIDSVCRHASGIHRYLYLVYLSELKTVQYTTYV